MTESPEASNEYVIPRLVQEFPVAGALLGILVGSVVLLGCLIANTQLQALFMGAITVKPNAAAAIVFASVALLLYQSERRQGSRQRKPLASLFAAAVATIGLLTMSEYVFNRDFGIDQLIFHVPQDAYATATPGRMAMVTAFCLSSLGLGQLAFGSSRRGILGLSPALLLSALAAALMALLGYAYGPIATVGLGQGVRIAIPSALMLCILAAGTLLLVPEKVGLDVAFSPHAGGRMARRLLPFALLVPLVLGGMRIFADRFGLFSVATQTGMVAVLTMLLFGVLIWRTALTLEATDKERELAALQVKDLQRLLPICSYCKKVRNESDYWQQVESYLMSQSSVEITHSICPACFDREMATMDELDKSALLPRQNFS